MTLNEALPYVLSANKKITCTYFHDEWLGLDFATGEYIFEDGCHPGEELFASARTWNTDWWIIAE